MLRSCTVSKSCLMSSSNRMPLWQAHVTGLTHAISLRTSRRSTGVRRRSRSAGRVAIGTLVRSTTSPSSSADMRWRSAGPRKDRGARYDGVDRALGGGNIEHGTEPSAPILPDPKHANEHDSVLGAARPQ